MSCGPAGSRVGPTAANPMGHRLPGPFPVAGKTDMQDACQEGRGVREERLSSLAPRPSPLTLVERPREQGRSHLHAVAFSSMISGMPQRGGTSQESTSYHRRLSRNRSSPQEGSTMARPLQDD